MKDICCIVAVMIAGMAVGGGTLLDLPVSVTNNAVYLSSMTERPWWNDAWQKRRPILVSGLADEEDDKAVVDCVVDFGEPVRPEDVRVVTPWETEVECVAEKVEKVGGGGQRTSDSLSRGEDAPATRGKGVPALAEKSGTIHCPPPPSTSTSLRLIFQTRLRVHENRPFLVYYDRQGEDALATTNGATSSLPGVQLAASEDSFHLQNGVLDVVFDRRHATPGLIRSLRLLGSNCRTLLFSGANGYAAAGFVFEPNGRNGWDKGAVVLDTPVAKAVRFECASAVLTFTLYAEQPRIDWDYALKGGGTRAYVRMNWAPGDGSSFDDFFYCGKSGKILTQRASLDFRSDSVKFPDGKFTGWLGEGWYAFGERRMGDIAGLAFDREAAWDLGYDSYYGLSTTLVLGHRGGVPRGVMTTGRGAIVATLGSVHEFRKICRRIERPVAVSVGAAQAKVSKPYRIPRLDRDWCCDYDVGFGYPGDSGTAKPLPADPDWALNVANRMRSYGSTTLCLMYGAWSDIPIKDRGLYDRIRKAQFNKAMPSWVASRKCPSFEEVQNAGGTFRAYVDAIHAKGLGVHTWCSEYIPGWYVTNDIWHDKDLHDISLDIQMIRVGLGQDCAYSSAINGEGVYLPKAMVERNGGSPSYWTWKNPQEAFDAFDRLHGFMREFYTKFKAKYPDVPVFLWNSENGEIGREKFMSEDEGYFDTMVVEMLPHHSFGHCKHVAKRMRSHFNNVPAKTVWHHYYLMRSDTIGRIKEIEWPFLFGVNGYSQENLSYEATDIENSEVTADFFRFAEYTRLGEKVAAMGPVKNVGVYRDPKAFREDILKKRRHKCYQDGLQDGRVRAFSELKNFNYDVIGPKFFNAKDLAQYKVVYVPEDDVISEDEVRELLAYVENGGSAIVEGVMGEKSKSKVEVEERRTDTLRRTDTPVRSEQGSNNSILRLGLGTSTLTLKDNTITPYGKGKILWYKEVKTDRIAKRDAKAMAEVCKAIADMGGVEPYAISALNGQECPFSGKANGQECPFSGLDGNLQAGPDGLFLGLYNSGSERQGGVVTLRQGGDALATKNGAKQCGKGVLALAENKANLHCSPSPSPSPSSSSSPPPSTSTSLYALDVKRGTRQPVTNDAFVVSVEPGQCAYYLIGDDAFTAIPAVTNAVVRGPGAVCAYPCAGAAKGVDITGFTPTVTVEITGAGKDGEPFRLLRSLDAKHDVRRFSAKTYDGKACRDALKTASLIHFAHIDSSVAEPVFEDCADALKALLKRGGGILFTRTVPGPKAQAFLKEVGVFDPYPSVKKVEGDYNAKWTGPDGHPFLTACWKSSGHENAPGEKDWVYGGLCGNFACLRFFTQWDKANQRGLFPSVLAGADHVGLVLQEKVLGAGRVAFNENLRSFTSWYEPKQYGDNLLSYMAGVSSHEHAEKMTSYIGGPGEVLKE